jgi:putative ABC transport system substrate-binding protein
VKRRELILALVGAAAFAPLAARAQQPPLPLIGYIGSSSAEVNVKRVAAFRKGGGDPVELGLVASMKRPGGNVTGVNILNVELTAKRLGLLRELAPRAIHLAVLANPNSVMSDGITRNAQASAPSLGLPVEILRASNEREMEAAFAELSRSPGAALLVGVDPFFFTHRVEVTALAARYAIPTIYYSREFPEVGGLISYSTDVENVCELTGVYTGRILKGEKPADLPVAQPTKFETVVNSKAARALGLEVPDRLLALADEVIE